MISVSMEALDRAGLSFADVMALSHPRPHPTITPPPPRRVRLSTPAERTAVLVSQYVALWDEIQRERR